MNKYTKSIGKDKAIALANSNWWDGKTDRQICEFQLFVSELSMPFARFHEALEKSLGRPVFTHELGLNYEGICEEFLGSRKAPSIEEILSLVPSEKSIVLLV